MTTGSIPPPNTIGRRLLYVVALPTGSAFGAWGVMYLGEPLDPAPIKLVVAGLLPLLGLIGMLIAPRSVRDPVVLGPFVLPAMMTVAFAGSMIYLARAIAREPDGAFIPVLQFGLGFFLPWVTLISGLASLAITRHRAALAAGITRRPFRRRWS